MAEARDIEIFQIAKTRVDTDEVNRWLDFIGADAVKFWEGLPADITDPAMLVALAGKRCYMSFEAGLNPNVTKIRESYAEYFDNILASGHGSVLEHSVYSFAVENCTRVFTAEMNRHRAGWAMSEGSLRFIRFDRDIPFWMPLCLRDAEDDTHDLRMRKTLSRELFEKAFTHQESMYQKLIDIWGMDESSASFAYKKKVTSCLRRIVGMGVCTGGVWTGNARALRHVITMRASPAAEEEILHVFSRIAAIMAENEPLMFGDFQKDDQGFWRPKYVKV